MRKQFVFFLLCWVFAAANLYAQSNAMASSKHSGIDSTEAPYIAFTEKSFDFGDIKEGDQIEHIFRFENKGKAPLVLAGVLTTCGCTATKWTRTPIAPGGSGEVVVKFDSKGKHGIQTKTITVNSNAYNARERLFIRTNIVSEN